MLPAEENTGEAESEDLEESELDEEEVLSGEGESGPCETEAADGKQTDAAPGEQGGAEGARSNGNRGVGRHTKKTWAAAVGGRMEAGRLTDGGAAIEARFLLRAVRSGAMNHTEAIGLIAVPELVENELRSFAELHPGEGRIFIAALRFRRRVMLEFERLAASVARSPSAAGDRVLAGGCGAAAGASTREAGLDGGAPQGLQHSATDGGAA